MIQRRQGFGFTLEPRQAIVIVSKHLGDNFDRHVPVELHVAGAKDLPHGAFADRRDDLVDADANAGHQHVILVTSSAPTVLSGPRRAPLFSGIGSPLALAYRPRRAPAVSGIGSRMG